MIIEAKSPEQAIYIAKSSNWQQHLEDGDQMAAYDWEPDAEELLSPNSVLTDSSLTNNE